MTTQCPSCSTTFRDQLRDEEIGAQLVGGDAHSGGHQRSAIPESQMGVLQFPPAVERQVLSDFLLDCIVRLFVNLYCQVLSTAFFVNLYCQTFC